MNAALAGFDILALLILFASGIMALTRGFVREALTVTALVAAALAALWTRPVFAPLMHSVIGSALFANLISMGVVFLLVYLAVSFVTGPLTENIAPCQTPTPPAQFCRRTASPQRPSRWAPRRP